MLCLEDFLIIALRDVGWILYPIVACEGRDYHKSSWTVWHFPGSHSGECCCLADRSTLLSVWRLLARAQPSNTKLQHRRFFFFPSLQAAIQPPTQRLSWRYIAGSVYYITRRRLEALQRVAAASLVRKTRTVKGSVNKALILFRNASEEGVKLKHRKRSPLMTRWCCYEINYWPYGLNTCFLVLLFSIIRSSGSWIKLYFPMVSLWFPGKTTHI